jgi:multidrug efflux pump subunit AcrA (membrane-fusion protein)
VAAVYQAVAVERRDIVVTAQAAGAVNPDTVVQVKSKASGEILDVKIQTGDFVQRGTLMVQVDQRIPQNDVATAEANLEVAKAQLLMFLTPKEFEPRHKLTVWPCRLVPVEQLENDDDDRR